MSIKKHLILLLLIMSVCYLPGCQAISAQKTDYQEEDELNWKWQYLGFKGNDVQNVQVTDQGVVYALTEGKLYVLDGEEWKLNSPSRDITAFYVQEKENNTQIFAGSSAGEILVKGKNKEWTETSFQAFNEPIDIITAGPERKEIFVGQSSKEGGGLFKSGDEGQNWERLTDITVRGVAVHPQNPEIIYIVDRLTYCSDDGGKTWNKVDTPANYGALLHPLYPEAAYLVYPYGVVMATHEGEITSQLKFNLPGGINRLEFNPRSIEEWALGLWDYPSGTGGLYYSFNGGSHWVKVKGIMENTKVNDLFFSQDGKKLYVATDEKGLWLLNPKKLHE